MVHIYTNNWRKTFEVLKLFCCESEMRQDEVSRPVSQLVRKYNRLVAHSLQLMPLDSASQVRTMSRWSLMMGDEGYATVAAIPYNWMWRVHLTMIACTQTALDAVDRIHVCVSSQEIAIAISDFAAPIIPIWQPQRGVQMALDDEQQRNIAVLLAVFNQLFVLILFSGLL